MFLDSAAERCWERGRLFKSPACTLTQTLLCRQVEEVLQLRRGECWRASGLQVHSEASTPLEGVAGSALDVTLVLERCVHAPSRL